MTEFKQATLNPEHNPELNLGNDSNKSRWMSFGLSDDDEEEHADYVPDDVRQRPDFLDTKQNDKS